MRNKRLYHLLLLICCWIPFSLFPQNHTLQKTTKDCQDTLPPGQRLSEDFIYLHYDHIPDLKRDTWSLKIDGRVNNKVILDWKSFSELDTVGIVCDFHCVTGWSRLDNHWTGVRLRDVLKLADPKSSAKYITFYGADDYTTSLPIEACTGDNALLTFRWEGKDLNNKMGGPVRVVIPSRYGYKSIMWLIRMKLTKRQIKGYWEKRGYSDSANPWKEERMEENKEGN